MNGDPIILHSTAPNNGEAIVQIEGQSDIYRVASPAIERFLQGAEWFADRRMLTLDPREEMDMVRMHTKNADVVIQQDLSTGFWSVLRPQQH